MLRYNRSWRWQILAEHYSVFTSWINACELARAVVCVMPFVIVLHRPVVVHALILFATSHRSINSVIIEILMSCKGFISSIVTEKQLITVL